MIAHKLWHNTGFYVQTPLVQPSLFVQSPMEAEAVQMHVTPGKDDLEGSMESGKPEFEDHSTHMVGPHGKSKRYRMVVRRVYLGVSEGCGRAFDRQDTRRGLHSELFEVGRHVRRQARALHHGEPVDLRADSLDLL
jgi:hypothetical protein